LHRLTELFVRTTKVPDRVSDGGNLILQVTKSKRTSNINKSWVFGYQLNKRYREMGLGAYPKDRSLAEARAKAKELRQLLVGGSDPIEDRDRRARAIAAEAAKDKTSAEVFAEYIKLREDEWRAATLEKWKHSLEVDAKPLAKLPVGGITIAEVAD